MSSHLPSPQSISEAANRPLEYNPKERAEYVRVMVKDITTMLKNGETEENIRSKVPTFIETYPELFKKMMKKEDLTPVFGMIHMLDKMGEGRLSQHEASVVIGKTLMDRYVTPQLHGKK